MRQLQVGTVFGVPGDSNLKLLDHVYTTPGLKFIGCSNELNTAYSADGYARAKGTLGCLVTTFGVGELSALNGVAGSMAEHVPVVHVVGQNTRAAQEGGAMLHHNVGDYGHVDHSTWTRASVAARCAAAQLWDAKRAASQIDDALRKSIVHSQPAYVFFPHDMVDEVVSAELLEEPIDTSLPVDAEAEANALDAIEKALQTAEHPMLIVDYLARAHGKQEARALAERLSIPTFSTTAAKTIVDESAPYLASVYPGDTLTFRKIKAVVKNADLLLNLGWFPADVEASQLPTQSDLSKWIKIQDNHVIVKGQRFDNVYMAPLIRHLIGRLDRSNFRARQNLFKIPQPPLPVVKETDAIRHNYIWQRFSQFLHPGDHVLAESGTTSYGVAATGFPIDSVVYSQMYWCCIGWATPAAIGVGIAARELHGDRHGRTVLITGDGALTLTIQAVATMIDNGLAPVVVIINNDGYTVERAIHGPTQTYNDVAPINFRYMSALFGGKLKLNGRDRNYRAARTVGELEAAFQEPQVLAPTELQVVEVYMDKFEIPANLAQALPSVRKEKA